MPDRSPTLLVGTADEDPVGGNDVNQVLVHPGSGSARKNWPPHQLRALIERMCSQSWPVSILIGPADRAAAQALGTDLPQRRPKEVLSLAPVLGRSTLFVGNDSGVTHLSARLGVPTVAVFGPTDPRQWAPRGPRVRVVGHPTWPSVDDVWDAVQEVLR
jgi:ADP-heptose:LPS heptosyltransferase